jgi:hypothetical protein
VVNAGEDLDFPIKVLLGIVSHDALLFDDLDRHLSVPTVVSLVIRTWRKTKRDVDDTCSCVARFSPRRTVENAPLSVVQPAAAAAHSIVMSAHAVQPM